MTWSEVREQYPNSWVKISIVESHADETYMYVDKMEVLRILKDNAEATAEFSRQDGKSLVFHTKHPEIKSKLIKDMGMLMRKR